MCSTSFITPFICILCLLVVSISTSKRDSKYKRKKEKIDLQIAQAKLDKLLKEVNRN